MQVRVPAEAVASIVLRDETKGCVISCRPAERRARAVSAVVATGQLARSLPVACRLVRSDTNETSQRIRAVSRALRPAQHFDLIHVVKRCGHADAGEVDIVDQETD